MPKCDYPIAEDDIQLDELDGLKADLLSLQASVHKLAGVISIVTPCCCLAAVLIYWSQNSWFSMTGWSLKSMLFFRKEFLNARAACRVHFLLDLMWFYESLSFAGKDQKVLLVFQFQPNGKEVKVS